ncbi:MAG: hypothetical protein SGJ07_04300 [Rhodospirillaceae bacterium]|nr:hypothetical protein [Rhodospirillaceae bacterium]
MGFLRSAALFLWGITKRFYFWLPALLLDPFDLYNKYIRAKLPSRLQVEGELPSEYFPWVLGVGLGWAGIITYYELAKKVGRDPKVVQRLQDFYVEGEELALRPIKSDEEMRKLKIDVSVWYKKITKWLDANMAMAAKKRFSDTGVVLPMSRGTDFNPEHMSYVNTIQKYRSNIQGLVESDAWDRRK